VQARVAKIGIAAGKHWSPNESAFVGEAMAKANDLAKRTTEPYWSGARWKLAPGLDPSQRERYHADLERSSDAPDWAAQAIVWGPGGGARWPDSPPPSR